MLLADVDFGNSVERAFNSFFDWLPNLVGALVILIVGYIVAKMLGSLVGRVLHRAGLDRTLGRGQAGSFVSKITSSPSSLLGTVAFWAIMLGVLSIAVGVLGIGVLEDFVSAVWAYLPNVIAALLIFLAAGAIAAGVSTLVARFMGDTGIGKIVATVAPILVMTIATFMILDQLQIAENIVTITYAALIGAVALGSALAFGLGGREVASQMLEGAYQKGQANAEQVKQDVRLGADRARAEAEVRKDQLQSTGERDSPTQMPGTTTSDY